MKEPRIYKSLKLPFPVWQALARIAATTGEPRSHILTRLVEKEEARQIQSARESAALDEYTRKLQS